MQTNELTKHIVNDYNNGIKLLKVSLMNGLMAVNKGITDEVCYKCIPWVLLLSCIKEYTWDIIEECTTPSGVFIKVNSGETIFVCSKSHNKDDLVINKFKL